MPLEELKDLPIQNVAADDCILFCWTTFPHLASGEFHEVIKHWNFDPKTAGFVWRKLSRSGTKGHFGLGYYTRADSEPCFICRRGNPPRVNNKSIRQTIEAPIRQHSRKPAEQYGLIEQLYDGPYLELFARESREGWDCWGNETERFDAIHSKK